MKFATLALFLLAGTFYLGSTLRIAGRMAAAAAAETKNKQREMAQYTMNTNIENRASGRNHNSDEGKPPHWIPNPWGDGDSSGGPREYPGLLEQSFEELAGSQQARPVYQRAYPGRWIWLSEQSADQEGGSHGKPPRQIPNPWGDGDSSNGPREYPTLLEYTSAQLGGSHGKPPRQIPNPWGDGDSSNGPREYPGPALAQERSMF